LLVNGIPLISKYPDENNTQTKVGEYYICTLSNTKTKKKQIEDIAFKLGVEVNVEIFEV